MMKMAKRTMMMTKVSFYTTIELEHHRGPCRLANLDDENNENNVDKDDNMITILIDLVCISDTLHLILNDTAILFSTTFIDDSHALEHGLLYPRIEFMLSVLKNQDFPSRGESGCGDYVVMTILEDRMSNRIIRKRV